MRRLSALACLLLLGACASEETPQPRAGEPEPRTSTREKPREPPLRKARCPAGAANCRAASGPIVYVEAVDADGDGDAHFVLATPDGLSGPGITVIDVARRLRPRPLPGTGDRISAAGPVYTGSYGQRQIQATEVHVAR